MDTFTVAVEFTDRSRTPAGRFNIFRTSVDVLAGSASDAQLVAVQLVAATRCDLGCMVTASSIA